MRKRLPDLIISFIFISCFFLTGCKKGMPKEIIPPANMEEILYDYHMARAMADELPYDDRYKQPLYYEYVFNKHNTTQATFDSSMVWYSRNTGELSKIYEKVNARLKSQQQYVDDLLALQENRPKTSLPGDSIDVWYDKRIYKLNSNIFSNKLTFVLPADTNFKVHDKLVWKANYIFLPFRNDYQDSARMSLSIRFENDSLISTEKTITSSGLDSLVLTSDSTFKLKEIQGFIYYLGEDKKELLLSNLQLMRYHRTLTDSISSEAADSVNVSTPEPLTQQQKVTEDNVHATPDTVSRPVRRSPREIRDGNLR